MFPKATSFVSSGSKMFHSSQRPRCCPQRRQLVTSQLGERDPIAQSPLGPPLVICVGEVLYDRLSSNPDAVPVESSEQWNSFPGGAPANLAIGLARLQTASAIIGGVGDDTYGSNLRALLSNGGVNIDGLQVVSSHPTRAVYVRNDSDGDRSFVAFNAPNTSCADAQALDHEALPGVLFYAAQLFVTGTLSLAFPGSKATVCELAQLAEACRLRVVVDVNWRPVFWEHIEKDAARAEILSFLRDRPGADFVKVSLDDAEFLFGQPVAKVALEEPRVVLEALQGRAQGVLVTAGDKGASYVFNANGRVVSGRVDAMAPPGDVVDTTGAGDAFLAGFLSEMMHRGGIGALEDQEKTENMARFAAATAAHVVTAQGAVDPQPTREQVEAFLRNMQPAVK